MNKLVFRIAMSLAFLLSGGLAASAATVTWSGLGSDYNASDSANWMGGAAPQSGDSIVFDGTSSKDCLWDLELTLSSLLIDSSYGGTITHDAYLVITGNVTVSGGTVIVDNENLMIGGTSTPPVNEPTLVTTIGRGSFNIDGELSYPSGLTVDNNGNVYVCSVSGDIISKFDDEGDFLTRWQTPECFGIEADDYSNIYVAGKFRDKIIKYDSYGTLLLEWGTSGNGDGQFRRPNDVAVNRSLGLIYVADSENLRIQVFDLNGNFQFKWGEGGSGNGQFRGSRGPLGIAVDQNSGAVYVADSDARRIQKFDQNGNFLLAWGSSGTDEGEFRWPRGIEVDSNGLVYIVDGDNERIQIFDSSGNFIMAINGLPGTGDPQLDPGFTPPGCYIHFSHMDCTATHNEIEGPFHPRDIAVDLQSGDIFVAATYAQRIDKFDTTGNFIKSWGWREKDNGVFNKPSGMTIDIQNGSLYVADAYNFLIQKFDLSGNYLGSWGYSGRVSTVFDGGDGSFDFPASVAVDTMGNVYVLRDDAYYPGDPPMHRIQQFDQDGEFLSGWNYPDLAKLHVHQMQGVAYNPSSGYLCVSNAYYDTVQCFDVTGTLIFEFGGPGSTYGKFNFPSKIAVDRTNGSMYVIDLGNSRIQKFTDSGVFQSQWGTYGSGDNQFKLDKDSGIYLDDNGYVYIADSLNNQVKVFDSNGIFILKIYTGGKPAGIVVDTQGYIYVVNNWNNYIQKFSPITN
jgi:tripartite motif-containing protein 71